MKLPRRKFLHLSAGAAALPVVPRVAWAQAAFPSRPVRLIVGVPPGGQPDIIARLMGQSICLTDLRPDRNVQLDNLGAPFSENLLRAIDDSKIDGNGYRTRFKVKETGL